MSYAVASSKKSIWVGLIGNMIDHYDTALYGFLAPFIAPLIFPDNTLAVALIKTYGIMSLSLVMRPLGALFFGSLGARYGAKIALAYSLTGLAVVTCAMGFLPTYAYAGGFSCWMLAFLRLAQGFFASGETTIAPFFILDNQQQKKRGLTDSIYQSSTVMGELLASLAAVLVSSSSHIELYWRIPFWISSITACIGIYLRIRAKENYLSLLPTTTHINILSAIRRYKVNFLRVIIASGMSYITYSIPFIFFNSFIPQISAVTYKEMMTLNTTLLALDMLALPLFGILADKVSPARLMSFMAALLALFTLPLFLMLNGAGLIFIIGLRIFIVLIGLGFCASIHAWFMTQFHGPERYVLVGLAYSFGSEALGRSAPAICLLLFNLTHSPAAPALYIVAVSSLAWIALRPVPLLVSQKTRII